MIPAYVSIDEVRELAHQRRLADTYGPLLVIQESLDYPEVLLHAAALGAEPCVVIGSDVVALSAEDRERIVENVGRSPIAAVTTCQLIRASVSMSDVPNSTEARLLLESTTYSTLQSGPEFTRWQAERKRASTRMPIPGPAVLLDRIGKELQITLNRPHRGNAVNRQLRDELSEGLALCLSDPSIDALALRGNGPHFSTGGDLDEFGTFANPADAQVIRTQRSPARLLSALSGSVHRRAHLHGNSAGSGIELAAFADHVTSKVDTTFWLPELSLGLVPGAGGTVSIVDRIGAPRTVWLLLTGTRIDATTALEWGLIDEISG